MIGFARIPRILAAAAALFCLPATSLADEALHLRRVDVIDRAAPEGATRAFSTLIPADWTTDGGIVWLPASGCQQGPRTVWNASSADEAYSIAFLPTQTWGAGTYGRMSGCHDGHFETADQTARAYLGLTPDVRVNNLRFERPESLDQIVSQFDQMTKMMMQGVGNGHADGVIARGQVTAEGRTHDLTLLMITMHTVSAMPDGWGGQMWTSNTGVLIAIGMTTPVGESADHILAFNMIVGSLAYNPDWQRQTNAWWARKNRSDREHFAEMSRINTETNNEIMDIITTGHREREAIRDEGFQRQIEGIRETGTWQASDGRVELPDSHNHVWELDDGTFVLTDDEFFNPNRDLSVGGEEIQRSN